jgi:hypothetical protein
MPTIIELPAGTYTLTGDVSGSRDVLTLTASITETTLSVGQTASITTNATAGTATYQWRLDGTPISGATSATYTTAAAGALTCIVDSGVQSVTTASVTVVSAPTRSYLGSSRIALFNATHNHTAPVSLNAGQKYVFALACSVAGSGIVTSMTVNGTVATELGYFKEPQNGRVVGFYEVTPASSGTAIVLTADVQFGTYSRLAYYEVSNGATFQNITSAEDRFAENLSLNTTVSAGDLLIGVGHLESGTSINFSAGLAQDDVFTTDRAIVFGSAANVDAASPRTITLNRTGGSNTGFVGMVARFS